MTQSADTVRSLLAGLVKAALLSADEAGQRARADAASAQTDLRADPAGLGALKLDGLWTLAIREAEAPELLAEEGRVSFTFPAGCPFTAAELADPDFDVSAAVERVRKSASTG